MDNAYHDAIIGSVLRDEYYALLELRRFIVSSIESFDPDTPQIWQWPRNIET